MKGKVYLIGAGPGAPDLITVRGADILKRADIVFYDALVHPDTVALAMNAKKVAVGKRCSRVSTDQRFINRNLVEAGHKYRIVVRLTRQHARSQVFRLCARGQALHHRAMSKMNAVEIADGQRHRRLSLVRDTP